MKRLKRWYYTKMKDSLILPKGDSLYQKYARKLQNLK